MLTVEEQYNPVTLVLIQYHDIAALLSCRVMEMPYAYQCCAFGACENHYRISSQWNKDDNSSIDDFHRKDTGLIQIQGNHHLRLLSLPEGWEQPVIFNKSNTVYSNRGGLSVSLTQ